jgi:ABC-2 type transport system ATP-binding protein
MENAIYVRDLKKTYDNIKYAVDGISFDVRQGEVYGLLGKNGAGKSTTIKILSTLIKKTSGDVKILGMDIGNSLEIRKRIGVVQQDLSFDLASVEKNFLIYGMLWNIDKRTVKSRMEELISVFGLENERKKNILDLSGGQKKRVQVAREFLHDMDLLFLDEPTVGMDPIVRRNLLDFIKSRVRDGLTVIFTTHIMEEADYLCDRIGIINDGKIVREGNSEYLKDNFGGYKTLRVSCNKQADVKTIEKIKSLGINTSTTGDELLLTSKTIENSMPEIIKILEVNGYSIAKMSMDQSSLEDVFFEVVN